MHFRRPGTYTLLFYVMRCAVGRVDLCPFRPSSDAVLFGTGLQISQMLDSHADQGMALSPLPLASCPNEFSASDDLLYPDLLCFSAVHFNALEPQLDHGQRTAVWRRLFPS